MLPSVCGWWTKLYVGMPNNNKKGAGEAANGIPGSHMTQDSSVVDRQRVHYFINLQGVLLETKHHHVSVSGIIVHPHDASKSRRSSENLQGTRAMPTKGK